MRNLRKYFAVFVAVALLVTAMAPAFAADTATTTTAPATLSDSKIVETLGMLKGEGGVITDAYLKTSVTRIQAAIMFLRLKGLESAALAFTAKDNFADASKVDWDGGKAVLGYLKANKDLGWLGDGTNFNPNATITAQEYYKILLTSLGYVQDKDFKFDDTLTFAATKGLKAAAKADPFTISDVSTATVEGLKATVNNGTKTLVQTLVDAKVIDAVKAAASTLVAAVGPDSFVLSAKDAKNLYVKFGAAVADTAKVTITVTRDAAIPVTTTNTFDADKAGVVLASTTNLPTGDYTVAIKNDTKDLGKQVYKVEDQKVAKIEMKGDMIIRTSDTAGEIGFKVTDQYGTDITGASLSSSNITFTCSLGSGNIDIDWKNAVIKLTKDGGTLDQLKDQKVVVITGVDSQTGASMTKSLSVSDTVGAIADVKLIGITNKEGKTVINKGTSYDFYLDFSATDANGNKIDSYSILSNTNAFRLLASSSTICDATIVQDPDNNQKAKIKLVPGDNTGSSVITAVGVASGKTANYVVEVKSEDAIYSLTLQLPSQDVASGEVVSIPYTAVDALGSAVTSYSTVATDKVTVTASDGDDPIFVQNPDGSCRIQWIAPSVTETEKTKKVILTATVTSANTVKMSQMNLTVKSPAYPYDITALNTTEVPAGVVYGTSVEVRPDRFTTVDQYSRSVDLRFGMGLSDNLLYNLPQATFTPWAAAGKPVAFYQGLDGYLYYVAMSSSDASVIKVDTTNTEYIYGTYGGKVYGIATGNKSAFFKAADTRENLGTKSTSLTFSLRKILPADATSIDRLLDTSAKNASSEYYVEEVDSFSYTVYNVDRKDINKYAFDAVTTPLYANDAVTTAFDTYVSSDGDMTSTTGQQRAWEVEYKLRGYYGSIRTLLPASDVVSYSISNPSKFLMKSGATASGQSTKVLARTLNDTSETATATAKLSATVKGYNSVYYVATADITAKKEAPAAASISVSRNDAAVIRNIGADYYTITSAYFNTRISGKYVWKYCANGYNPWADVVKTAVPFTTSRSDIFFAVKDQYGKEGSYPASINVVRTDAAGTLAATQPTIGADYIMNLGGLAAANGDYFKITVVAANGVSKTITIMVKD